MKSLFYFTILVVILFIFSRCVYNKAEVLYPNNKCDTTNITFTGKVAPVFANHCLSCHGNAVSPPDGAGIRLQDYADVKTNLALAYAAMTHQSGLVPMPLGQTETIDACEITIVRIWKDAGAPNN